MKKTVKKALSLFLCMVLCLSLLPVSAFAEDETETAEVPAGAAAEVTASGDENVAIDESNFPDAAFRSYISENVDADSDGVLSPEEIASVTSISCNGLGLTSLEGIGFFPNLNELSCQDNQLAALDLSRNTALQSLNCNSNQLTALNVSGCTALKSLNCFFNQLTALDASGLTALETLNCGANQLTELNMSGCTALKTLGCVSNQLTELDVSGFPNLDFLYCTSNQLSGLDLRQNTALRGLYCEDNRLTALDLGENSKLQWGACSGQSVSVPGFTQSGEKYLFDLSTLVGAENTGKITSVEKGEYDPETGIASFDAPGSFTYYYTTGNGDTLMDVTCEYESSPVPDENGDYHITSFAELKVLAAQEYTESTTVFYDGTETFVFEEDLTLPVNLVFSSGADIRIPSGVTVTTNEIITCSYNTLYVEGTLVAYGGIDLQHINVSGSLQSYAYISIPSTGEITGEENVVFYPSEEYPKGGFHIGYTVSGYDAFLEAVQAANANLPNRFYLIELMAETTTTIDREISLGDNALLGVFSPLVIAENGALNLSHWMNVVAPVTINGSMNNASRIVIYHWAEPSASLTLGETGSYSGTGEITIYSDTLSSPDEAVPGFDLSDFDIADNGRGWTLTPKAAEETTPGDMNGDGKVNTMDLIRLMKYISGVEVDMAEGAGDVNGDGKVNTMDLIRLMKIINGASV